MTALPAWVDPEAWAGFVEMRRRQEKTSRGKIAWTARAELLVIKELYKLKALGHDANQALDQSVIKGYTDVYAPKSKETPDMLVKTMVSVEPPMTKEERERSEIARQKVFGMVNSIVKRVA